MRALMLPRPRSRIVPLPLGPFAQHLDAIFGVTVIIGPYENKTMIYGVIPAHRLENL